MKIKFLSIKSACCMMLSLLILAAFSEHAIGQWTQQWPKPHHPSFNKIHMSSNGNGVISTPDGSGAFMITENFGQNWVDLPLPAPRVNQVILELTFASDTVGFISTGGQNFLKTTDGGRTWAQLTQGFDLRDIKFLNNQVGYGLRIVNDVYRISRTSDGGLTWQNRSTGQAAPRFHNYAIKNANTLFGYAYIAPSRQVLKSTNAGTSWTTVNIPGLTKFVRSISFKDENTGYAVGDSGSIAKTTDGGTTWQISYFADSTETYPDIMQVKFFSSQNGIMQAPENGAILKTTDGGNTWETIRLQRNINISMVDGNTLFGCGGDSYIGKSTNGGRAWQQLTKGDLSHITGGCFQNESRLWLTSGNKVRYTDDKGITFQYLDLPFIGNPVDVKFPTPRIGYILAFENQINGPVVFKTINGGGSWQKQTNLPDFNALQSWPSLERLQFIHPDTGFASGWAGVVKTVNGGQTWTSIHSNPILGNIHNTFSWFTSANEGVRVDGFGHSGGGDGLTYKTSNGGLSWLPTQPQERLPYPVCISFFDKNNGWFAGHTYIAKTSDGGNTWHRRNLPFQTIGYAIKFLTAQVGYVTSSFKDPFFTTDGGNTWAATAEGGYISRASVLLSQNGNLAVMAGDGGSFFTTQAFQRNYISNVSGSVIKASSSTCGPQSVRYPLPYRLFSDENNFFTSSDENGKFNLWLDTGSHQIRQIPLSPILARLEQQQCPPNNASTRVNILGFEDTLQIGDFVNTVRPCAVLIVNQDHFLMRPCRASRLSIVVQNQGNAASTPTSIQVKFPQHLFFVSADRTWDYNALDSTYRFQLPALQPSEPFVIRIVDSVTCNPNALTGANLCVTTKIANVPNCLLQSTSNWDGADLEVASRCLNGQTRFTIRNNGASMPATSTYRIFVGSDLAHEASFQLAAANQMVVSFAANAPAGIYRLEVPQSANHPLSTFAAADADCQNGTSTNGLFPQPGQSPLVDIVCVTVTNAYDPNDKLVWPKGVGADGNIEPGTELKYTLRFQNTGTDTAFSVVVRDTLSQFLNVETLQLGIGSHPYRLTITGQGRPVLNFHFDNILLPDSNRNEPMSHGQVSFTISPKINLSLGTRVENFTDIYFDYNDPIRTNTTVNTLWRPTIVRGVIDTVFVNEPTTGFEPKVIENKITLIPNPANGKVEVVSLTRGTIRVFDAQGRILIMQQATSEKTTIDISKLKPGMYSVQSTGSKPERLSVKP